MKNSKPCYVLYLKLQGTFPFYFIFNLTLCFTDEGRSAVDQAGGAQIVIDHLRSLCGRTDPASEKLMTVFCGMLMNYSNENGKQN
jgi:hypothetical protein